MKKILLYQNIMFWLSYECFSILCDVFSLKLVISSHNSCDIRTTVHCCTDSLVLLGHVNSNLELNRHDHIAYGLDNQYHMLRKKFLLGDHLPKRIMNAATNKKLFSTSGTSFNHLTPLLKVQKTWVDFLKTLGTQTKWLPKQNWSTPETTQQQ